MVRHIADGIWSCCRYRCFPPRTHTHVAGGAAVRTRGNGGVGNARPGPGRGPAVNWRWPLLLASLAASTACGLHPAAPGQPAADSQSIPPAKVLDFALLYGRNCAGCHGQNGNGGAAIGLGDPTYLAIADDTVITRVTADGVPGTAMPAFAQRSGGMLTDDQIGAIVRGMRSQWA